MVWQGSVTGTVFIGCASGYVPPPGPEPTYPIELASTFALPVTTRFSFVMIPHFGAVMPPPPPPPRSMSPASA